MQFQPFMQQTRHLTVGGRGLSHTRRLNPKREMEVVTPHWTTHLFENS